MTRSPRPVRGQPVSFTAEKSSAIRGTAGSLRLLVDLIHVTLPRTVSDSDGALTRTPTDCFVPYWGADAVLCLHGTGSNFYASNMMASLTTALVANGMAALPANTRGHDGISSTNAPVGRRLQGAAYEIIDACCHDVTAWLSLLRGAAMSGWACWGTAWGQSKPSTRRSIDPMPTSPGSWRFRHRGCRILDFSKTRGPKNSCATTAERMIWCGTDVRAS